MAFKRDLSWDGVLAIVAIVGICGTGFAAFFDLKENADEAKAIALNAATKADQVAADTKTSQEKIWQSIQALTVSEQAMSQNQAVLNQVVADHLAGPSKTN